MSGTGQKSQLPECDLVMRGGVTSGIVYPGVVAELAKTYRFRSIGGTSAGAIAAVVTAAASLGRDTGVYASQNSGRSPFADLIATMPGELGEKSGGMTQLEGLFQPSAVTKPIWRLVKRLVATGKPGWTRLPMLLLTMIGAFPIGAYFGALIGYGLTCLVSGSPQLGIDHGDIAALEWIGAAVAVVVILAGAIIGAATNLIRFALRILPSENYGLCPGFDPTADPMPLTNWLHERIQRAAGRGVNDPPVTFGDLWQNGGDPNAERAIELVLVATDVTRGTSHRAPFLEGAWGPLLFDEPEWRKLFPDRIVDHLKDKAAPADKIDRLPGQFRLPRAQDLPILVGARLSLSFPVLIQAMPLFATQWRGGRLTTRRVWFSDGGLTSNFPIHLFDSILPRRPTFGINLTSPQIELEPTSSPEAEAGFKDGGGEKPRFVSGGRAADVPDQWDRIYMPDRNSDGIGSVARFNDFKSVPSFLFAALDAARNWGDTEAMAQPGYRDRIVHIALAEDEGGMNLQMPKEVIEPIARRGVLAGKLLTARFAGPPGTNDPKTGKPITLDWNNHRWVRYRVAMAGLEVVLRRLRLAWTALAPGMSYDDLLNRPSGAKPTSYPMTGPQKAFARTATDELVAVTGSWVPSADQTFDRGKASKEGGSPRPKPTLRMTPSGDSDPRAERFWVDTTPQPPPAASPPEPEVVA